MTHDYNIIKKLYSQLKKKVDTSREILNKPLTFTEKILYSHLFDENNMPKDSYVNFKPDRVAMQDATAQMALLQFMQAGKNKVAVPSTVHCDHLIRAEMGSEEDLKNAINTNKEIYNFLSSVSNKYGIGFWKPGAGIIHQIVLENYAFPGGMMIGTDSHTPNAGGLGMVAIGVGGADAVDVMTGMPWELKFPKILGVKLTGKLSGWVSAKDVILKVAGILSVKGGTGYIIEYFGEGAQALSCTGKATICNMGAEIGATTSNFAYDSEMGAYLRATNRSNVADLANEVADYLQADKEVYQKPEKYYDKLIEIDLDKLEPYINGPFTPDLATPISEFTKMVEKNNWPSKLQVGLIGSCTNSSYEDISRAASVAKQALEKKLKVKAEYTITPGSEMVKNTVERDGYMEIFEKIGGTILANACGPCIGQWKREGADKEKPNSIMTSFNRNFAKRNDGNPNTHGFVASPEITTAFSIAGTLKFNPLTDTLTNEDKEQVKLEEPQGIAMPEKGFVLEETGYIEPAKDGNKMNVTINETSERLQKLIPFLPWDGTNFQNFKLLIKAKGKCTTDHISMAGPWLRFRGHLDNISNNCLIGAINYFNDSTNKVKNQLTQEYDKVPNVARAYKSEGIGSVIVGDENYGEGSSREHAAMEPRHLGVKVVLVKSFARIHETNLKKQGMLALTFVNKKDYDKIQEDDTIDVIGLNNFASNVLLTVTLHHKDTSTDEFQVRHTYNNNQIEWFKEGSALNLIKKSKTV